MNKLNKKAKLCIVTVATSLFLTGCAAGIKHDDSSYVKYIGNSNFVEQHENKDYLLSKLKDKKTNSTQCLIKYKSESYYDVVDKLNSVSSIIRLHECDALVFEPYNNQTLKNVPDEAFSRLAVSWDNRSEDTECKVTGSMHAEDSSASKDLFLSEIADQHLPGCKSIEIIYEHKNAIEEIN